MTGKQDEYDLFLQTWKPGERLIHASLPQHLSDPLSRRRLLADSTGGAPAQRAAFAPGPKVMESDELIARSYDFFEANHAKWVAEFRDYVLTKAVQSGSARASCDGARKWDVDGAGGGALFDREGHGGNLGSSEALSRRRATGQAGQTQGLGAGRA